uniref:NADH dehydrogenase [ubiquinone] 1 alpha subcomplex subunit 3 n=1 Tax=Sus scrofa TaxID=9823 RepID=A0A8D0XBH1_PIG
MAARFAAFLKNAWAKELVLVALFTIQSLAVILPALSPYTNYTLRINRATPYNISTDGESGHLPSGPQYKCENQKNK